MNFKKLFLVFLSVIFATSTLFASAVSSRGNVSCSEIVPQQAWYTKLIKLENLKSKDVNGTLNFDLVPDNSANKKYLKSNEIDEITKEQSTVDVVPGLVNHSYKIPFSSNDYVDKKFNELAWAFRNDGEQAYALFNYAFLHEWGRIETSTNTSSFSVGKLDPKQFSNPGLGMTAEEQKDYYESQADELKKDEYKLSWGDDPDTDGVMGWKNNFGTEYYNSEDHLYDFLGAYEFGSQFLNEYEDFRKGTFDVVNEFSLSKNIAVNYTLKMTTRPIAINKTYDAQGNIKTIEKPLIPAKDAYNFIEKHNKKIDEEQIVNYYKNKIFRYKLIEKQSEGVDLPLPEKDLIVDVLAYGGKDTEIYVFENEKEADEFYQKVLDELDENTPLDLTLITGKNKLQATKKVQLINEAKATNVNVKKVWKDEDNKYRHRPESVTIKLLADGKDTGTKLVLNEGNNWSGVFSDLPRKNQDKVINYTVDEEKVDNYKVHITGNGEDGFVVTNTHYADNKTPVPDKQTIPKNNKSPMTGDNSVDILLAMLGMLVSAGMINIFIKKYLTK